MEVNSRERAFEMVDILFPTDYMRDAKKSIRAGYDIYSSTDPNYFGWIGDLGNRLEINYPDKKTVNIWIKTPYTSSDVELALNIVDRFIYDVEDKINRNLAVLVGLDIVKSLSDNAYSRILKIYNDCKEG